ncbi:MAG: hypothetical protein A2Y57_00170 [Candidatus Woykebacteria bacterium RBG_13_40_7b]|uniref:Nudix hydrolase domain-containing protein n=1 Tax=Candidatus Woykebacteria bacterium RBG_13_40_7b TaxID=1802594 RepID=A0A1G1W5Y5_9BACT|nr:MAG: hypothetical protein A2Y57_00170 [Candidatus Woykebacteria bacterium RBG_13_40_7b]
MKILKKISLAIIKDDKILLVRNKGFKSLLSPGGQLEKDEGDLESLQREIKEELNTVVDGDSLKYLETFEDLAADREDTKVRIKLYLGEIKGNPTPSSEVSEIVKFSKSDSWDDLSPILKNKIIPYLISGGYLK